MREKERKRKEKTKGVVMLERLELAGRGGRNTHSLFSFPCSSKLQSASDQTKNRIECRQKHINYARPAPTN